MARTMSYAQLARELGYGGPAAVGGSVLSWLEDGEMHHMDETRWLAFLRRFNLPTELQPATLVPEQTAADIRLASVMDMGVEITQETQQALDDLTADTMNLIYVEIMGVLTASFGVQSYSMQLASPATLEGVADAMLGRISPKLRDCARSAYSMDRM